MPWYAAHLIIVFEYKTGPQERFPIWENIVLVEADSVEHGLEKAKRFGRVEEGDDDGSLTVDDHPARRVFAGLRKLVECVDSEDRPGDGTEVSYNDLELDSRAAIERLVSGDPVPLEYF